MKKLISLLLILSMTISMVACLGESGSGTEGDTPDSADSAPAIETVPKAEPKPVPEQQLGAHLVISGYETDSYLVAHYDVRNYGAKGDGVTDDTAAIKAAIAEAGEVGGGTIFFPAGNYCVHEPLALPIGVILAGELEEGTANGTVLHIYCGKNAPEEPSFISLHHTTGIHNMAFYYPEQQFVDGKPIPYPYTLDLKQSSETVDLQNVMLVNSYNGIDFSDWINMLQTLRGVYGTVLNIGIHQDSSYDITRFEDIHFSPSYWLNCPFENIPDEEELRSYMHENSIGMLIKMLDWTYFSDIYIDGYYIGYYSTSSASGGPYGQLYNLNITDCYYPLKIDNLPAFGYAITNSTFSAVGDENATAVLLQDFTSYLSFVNCRIESEGDYAVVPTNVGGCIGFNNCTVTAREDGIFEDPDQKAGYQKYIVNSQVIGDESLSLSLPALRTDMPYNARKETKPASTIFIDMSKEPYRIQTGEDITERLQAAIDSLRETGGMVYLPLGEYYVESAITVHPGVEIRGQVDMPSDMMSCHTKILTDFGKNDPDGEALFNMKSRSGLQGLAFVYYNQLKGDIVTPYSYTVRGDGEDIYLCKLFFTSSYRGVDLGTNRCDNHYVEYFRGAPLDVGIYAGGGSENGLVRNIMYNNPNIIRLCFGPNYGGDYIVALDYLKYHGTPFKIGESTNQIFYNNFSYGGWRGIHVTEGAKDAFVLVTGIDSGTTTVYMDGDPTVQFVNTPLSAVFSPEADRMLFFETAESFTGSAELFNGSLWSVEAQYVFMLNGSGAFTSVGSINTTAGRNIIEAHAGTATFAGLLSATSPYVHDIKISEDITSLTLAGTTLRTRQIGKVGNVAKEKIIIVK